jgi:hypothetical protein
MAKYQDLGAILARYGIPVTSYVVPGRTTAVDWQGLMFHHTASCPSGIRCPELPSLSIVQRGRPDVVGPLSNFMTPRSGKYVAHITNGGANHPGAGDIAVLNRLLNDQPPTGRPGRDTANASSRARAALIGFECENNGIGEWWPGDHIGIIAASFAAFCMEFRWNPLTRIIGHKEWTLRKIDPFPIDMVSFRYQVAALVRTPAPITPPKPTPTEEDQLMSAADDIIDALKSHIDLKVTEAITAQDTRQATWEWDTRKLTVPRTARIEGQNQQFYVAPTSAGLRRFWVRNLSELALLRQLQIVSVRDELVIPVGSDEAAAFEAIPIAGSQS